MKKAKWFVIAVVIVIGILFLTSCGASVKYVGQKGTSKSWVCANGDPLDEFPIKVNSDAAEKRCDEVTATEEVIPATVDCADDSSDTNADSKFAYECKAFNVGPGDYAPVEEAGTCSFCTINYNRPGEVYISSDEISYDKGAHVWQYMNGSVDGFRECIIAQTFYTDADYTPLWQ